jgi:hypothetical protein
MASSGTGGGVQLLEWGGEVASGQPSQLWTETRMGSGYFASEADYAAWMGSVQYMASWGDNVDTSPSLQTNNGYDSNCYTAAGRRRRLHAVRRDRILLRRVLSVTA